MNYSSLDTIMKKKFNVSESESPPHHSSISLKMQEIDTALRALSHEPNNYNINTYVTPAICGIGVAYVGGYRSFLNTNAADAYAHEIGHNFRLAHSTVDANDDDVFEDECKSFTSTVIFTDADSIPIVLIQMAIQVALWDIPDSISEDLMLSRE
jgi:hypothetical protein